MSLNEYTQSTVGLLRQITKMRTYRYCSRNVVVSEGL